ncbi:MAG TPA: HNH endonuclease [Sphaerochaeta sp.]|nr:HNH endonuclease [Sphaerochaeta sp.]
MKLFVGVTDSDWYRNLSLQSYDEINFWKPGGKSAFKALDSHDLFLFKLHAPQNYIVGGGFFVKFSILPSFLAWDAFGKKNGTDTLEALDRKIWKYRGEVTPNPNIGCIILANPFFFSEDQWIPVPSDWSSSIVQGKVYDSTSTEGFQLFQQVQERLHGSSAFTSSSRSFLDIEPRVGETQAWYRLGQGSFRVLVTEAYNRRCAVSGEKTLPVLDAAHIKPFSDGGQYSIKNGLLLRTDIHTLFDHGYLTITKDYAVEVSHHLKEDYGNGKIYYDYHGRHLPNLPSTVFDRPSPEAIEWHNERIFLG